MTRRRWLLFLVVVLCLATLCALETQRIVTGWLRGEAFYQGRPTTYWRGQLAAWQQEHPWEDLYVANLNGGASRFATLVVDKDVPYSTLMTQLLNPESTDPIRAARLLSEGLANATSPTPFLIARPRLETHDSAVFVDPISIHWSGSTILLSQPRPETYWSRFTAWLGLAKEENPTRPGLLQGETDAEPVLQQLVDDTHVGEMARRGLRAIRQKAISENTPLER